MPNENNFLDDMIKDKEAASPYIKLSHLGESVKIFRLLKMMPVDKVGFGGKQTRALHFTALVDVGGGVVVEKTFDNSSKNFLLAVRDAGIKVGSSFVMTRGGENEKEKTRYLFTEVTNPSGPSSAPAAPTPPKTTPPTPTTPTKPTVAGAQPTPPNPTK